MTRLQILLNVAHFFFISKAELEVSRKEQRQEAGTMGSGACM